MSRAAELPFSIPLLLLDLLGALLLAAGIATHFAGVAWLPDPLQPWALPLAGLGFAMTIPFTLDMLRRARRRQRAADPASSSVIRRG